MGAELQSGCGAAEQLLVPVPAQYRLKNSNGKQLKSNTENLLLRSHFLAVSNAVRVLVLVLVLHSQGRRGTCTDRYSDIEETESTTSTHLQQYADEGLLIQAESDSRQ